MKIALTAKINEQQIRIARETKHMNRCFERMEREGYSNKLQGSIDHRLHNISVARAILVDLLLERVAELETENASLWKEYELS